MADTHKFDPVSQYSAFNKNETRHPLVNIIDLAKEKIFDPGKTASEVAYKLGFNY